MVVWRTQESLFFINMGSKTVLYNPSALSTEQLYINWPVDICVFGGGNINILS